jgi:precorrin-4 C11-methyltransferase
MIEKGKVFFIGAGPGDVELLTLKGKRLLECADLVLFAGSLVNPEILEFCAAGAEKWDTARMKLDCQVGMMKAASLAGKIIVRLHTGDPSIYGAIAEQMHALDREGVPYEVAPGVSSAFAAAAALGIEFTMPGVTQTLILTRMEGRTSMPEKERLRELAAHRCSMVIFLSTGLIAEVVEELRQAGYVDQTAVTVVYRASWPDQKILRATLLDIASLVEREELTHQALIIVSPVLESEIIRPSHLYGNYQAVKPVKNSTAIIALTAPSIDLGRRLHQQLPASHLFIPQRFLRPGDTEVTGFRESIRQVLQSAFEEYEALVCILASGIVVRELAPLLKNKHSDPAVVVMDPAGKFAVSLLSGHEGGANRLATKLAGITGGQAVITTASDDQKIPALDVLAKERGWVIHPRSRLAQVMTALVNHDPVALVIDSDVRVPPVLSEFGWSGKFTHWHDAIAAGFTKMVMLTCRQLADKFWSSAPDSLVCFLPALSVGVGCNRGAGCAEIMTSVQETLFKTGLSFHSVDSLATICDKADEAGLIEVCAMMDLELKIFDRNQIRQVKNLPNPSEAAMNALGVQGVAEPAAMLAAGVSSLLVRKQKFANVTIAVALREDVL